MGLLDAFTGEDRGLLGLMLLQAAAPKAGGRTGIGEGLLGAFQGLEQRKAAQQDRALKQQMLQAQMAEMQAQAQHRAAQAQAAQQAAQRNAAFQRALQGGAVTPPPAMAGGGGPTIANAAQIGQQQAPDIRALAMQFPEQADLLQKLASAGDWGRPEVARTEETMADGRPVRQQFDKFGRPVGGALPQWKAPVQADTGGAVNFIDPVTLQRLQSLSKTQSPDSKASNALGWANLGIARQRLALDQQQPKGQYDAERGLMVDPRTATATPVTRGGVPIGGKQPESVRKELMGINQQRAMIDGALKAVKEAPDAFGLSRGAATMIGPIAESVAGRFDSDKQRQARSFVFNNVSAVINERAGAAQSAQELARLRSFLPAETDNADQITSKFNAFKSYLAEKERGTTGAPSGDVKFLGFE